MTKAELVLAHGKLKRIADLTEEANSLMIDEIPEELREAMVVYHSYNRTLAYHLRWAAKMSNELFGNWDTLVSSIEVTEN